MEKWILEVSAAKEALIIQPSVQLNSTIKRIRQLNFKVRSVFKVISGTCVLIDVVNSTFTAKV
jgi:hypothetical protein